MRFRGQNSAGAGRGARVREIAGRRFQAPAEAVALAAEEPVVRLVASDGPIEARGVQQPAEESDDARRSRPSRMLWATLGMAATVLVLAVVAVSYVTSAKEEASGGIDLDQIEVEPTEEKTRMELFVAEIGSATEEARAMLAAYYEGAEVALRDPGLEVPAELRESMRPEGNLTAMVAGGDDNPFLTLVGRGGTMNLVRFVFVPGGEGIEFDLAASFGLGDLSLDELRGVEAGREVEMRFKVAPSNLYNTWFQEEEFASLRLIIQDLDEPVWGYVRRDSEAGRAIQDLLNQDSVFFTERRQVRATLRVARFAESRRPVFEVVGFVHEDWVGP